MDLDFNKNEDQLKQLCFQLQSRAKKTRLGGGEKKIKDQHDKGKLTARERIEYLTDKQTEFLEVGLFAGEGMYADQGGCPSGGVVTGIGYIKGRQCVMVANDATVKAGAWFPVTAKKNLRAQEIAMENRLPIVYLVDSAGVFLPMQDEIFPDKEHFVRQVRNNAKMSSMGIVQIAAIMGSCVAGGAYLPIMSDEAMIVDKTGSIFLAGSYLVKAAVGEDIDNETLGGATTHCEISGVTDNKFPNDQACLDHIRDLFDKLGSFPSAGFDRATAKPPKEKPGEIYGLLPADRTKPYDTLEIIKRLVDDSEFDEYKALYGKTILCGFARIDGWAVGIVANQRKVVKTKKGEMQMGGVIYSDSADKTARFIIGNSYGAGNYAMCGKAFDPRLIYAWPTAQIAVMSGNSAAKTLLQIRVGTLKAQGKEISKEEEDQLLKEIMDRYNEQLSPYYAAARLWVDGVVDPLETRKIVSMGIA